jgi:hypothetical protein
MPRCAKKKKKIRGRGTWQCHNWSGYGKKYCAKHRKPKKETWKRTTFGKVAHLVVDDEARLLPGKRARCGKFRLYRDIAVVANYWKTAEKLVDDPRAKRCGMCWALYAGDLRVEEIRRCLLESGDLPIRRGSSRASSSRKKPRPTPRRRKKSRR